MPKELAGREIGYYSLTLSILKEYTPEEAFNIIAPDPDISFMELRRQQEDESYRLNKWGLTATEIGRMLGVNPNTVYRRIKQYKRRANHAETSVHARISTR